MRSGLKSINVHFLFFLIGWLLVGWAQALFTELDPDEAYYWMYSRQLDWGYFDHPPMVAFFIGLGYVLLENELGVRLLFPLVQVFSFIGIWHLAGCPKENRDNWVLMLLLAAMPLLHIYGFVATPDGPLLFFAVLFLVAYQRFVQDGNWWNILLLAITMAALLYSKYHGVLLIFFVVLSNLNLLKKPGFYIASILGALLFLPHLYWQYEHNFPSFRYHLGGRNDVYELKYTITYVINQVVIFSPFIFPFIVQALRKTKVDDHLTRAYYFIIFGFWAFFFWSSFKGHTEPQWTGILSIPFVILVYRQALQDEKYRKWVWRMSGLSFLLLLIIRVLLVYNFLGIKSEFHNSEWVASLRTKANDRPVLFENSYRNASKYAFYTKDSVYAFTNVDYRKSQFDLWDWEKNIHNEDVLVIVNKLWDCRACTLEEMGWRTVKMANVDSLQVYSKITLSFDDEQAKKYFPGQTGIFNLKIKNPYGFEVSLQKGNFPLEMSIFFLKDGALINAQKVTLESNSTTISPGLSKDVIRFAVPEILEAGQKYQMGAGLHYQGLPPSVNSELIEVEIEMGE